MPADRLRTGLFSPLIMEAILSRISFGFLSLALAIALGACGGTAQPTAAGDAGAATDTVGAADVAGACNNVAITAPAVAATSVPASSGKSEPLAAGGAIADGTYFLTAHQSYGIDAVPMTYRTVLVFAGSQLQLAQIRNNGPEERATFTVTTGTNSFKASSTCPVAGQILGYDSYTATPTQLLLFHNERVVTLTRQ